VTPEGRTARRYEVTDGVALVTQPTRPAQLVDRAMERMATEPDFAEGVAALTERRPPRFGGLP
jgi:hypothetical protein